MRCEQAREALWPQPEAGHAQQDALTHFGSCAACQRFFVIQGALGARLGRLARVEAPAGLRDRVLARLSDPALPVRRAPRRRMRWLAGGGALLAAAATVVMLLVTPSDMPSHIAQPIVQEAQRGVTSLAVETDDHSQLQTWFEDRLGYSVLVPNIAGADLVGGRVTELGGIQTVHVLYRFHEAPITYFAWPTATVMGREVPEDRIVSATSDGHQLAVWTELGYARAVVAAMPKDDVMGFAIECRAKALMSATT